MEAVPDEFHLHGAHSLTYKGHCDLGKMFCKIWTLRVGILTMGRIWTRCSGMSETRFVTEHSHYRLFKKRWLRCNIWHTILLGKTPNLVVRRILADLWLMICEGMITGYIWYSDGVVRADGLQPCNFRSSTCMERIRWETSSRSASWDSSYFVELGSPISIFTKACHLFISWTRWNQSIAHHISVWWAVNQSAAKERDVLGVWSNAVFLNRRAERSSPGICHFSFLSNFHE